MIEFFKPVVRPKKEKLGKLVGEAEGSTMVNIEFFFPIQGGGDSFHFNMVLEVG
jgi:hypothetical protein